MTPWIAIVAALLAVSAGEATFATLNGEKVAGELVAWQGKQLTVIAADGRRQLSAESLLDAAWNRDAVPASVDRSVELIDGSRLAYAEFTIAQRVATVRLAYANQTIKIPTERIRRIELLPPSEALEAALAEIERKQPAGDSLVIVKRDVAAMDYLSGIIGDVTAAQADFVWDGDRVPVKLSKIAAMEFYHAKPAKLPDPLCKASLTDGSVIAVRQAALQGNELRLRTTAGVDLRVSIDQLARIDFSTGKIAYLSDLSPANVRWIPNVAIPKEAATIAGHGLPRTDASFSGAPLSLQWNDDPLPARRDVRSYQRGLAIRSRTELSYLVPPGMSRFLATAGIDPATANQGNVTLEIRGDARVLWEGVIDGRKPPTEIDVELGAARRLQLIVDYGENLDYGDRLHLIEARFTK
jgi:hypothetical protein